MYNIQVLNENQWEIFKQIRLEGLKNNPKSFSHSYENKVHQDQTAWQNKFSQFRTNIIIFDENKKPIAMAVIFFNADNKLKHIASIGAVYINSKHRGQGLGTKLIEYTINKIKQNKEIKKIKLTVIQNQTAAENLYKKFGFQKIGTNKKEIKINQEDLDLYNYELIL